MTFTHPKKTANAYHRMYFSDDMNMMFEKLMNHESFLYQRELSADFLKTKEVKWRLIKRIINRSIDISEFSFFNYLYSPDLNYFFDAYGNGKCAQIRRTRD
jgi:nuclear transport factor 2 (NTF2) superfamily protein